MFLIPASRGGDSYEVLRKRLTAFIQSGLSESPISPSL